MEEKFDGFNNTQYKALLKNCEDIDYKFDDKNVQYHPFITEFTSKGRLCPDLKKYNLEDKLRITNILEETRVRSSIKLAFM
jgi:hypothetical protein